MSDYIAPPSSFQNPLLDDQGRLANAIAIYERDLRPTLMAGNTGSPVRVAALAFEEILKLNHELKELKETSKLYFEAHVTLEPIADPWRRSLVECLAFKHQFRMAKLLMQKGEHSPDAFLTGRDSKRAPLVGRMTGLIMDLKAHQFLVTRYKIENTILDSRTNDELGLL